jgi:hypothetical protein
VKSNTLYAFLNGREYVLDGVHGHFVHSGEWPYERLGHEPSKRGKRTKRYQETKRRLRDDWSTDLSDSIERQVDIAIELGYSVGGAS